MVLPALPMDGGRIFRAALSKKYGLVRATEISVKVARGVSIAMGVYGLITGHIFFVGLAVLLWIMADTELKMAPHWRYGQGGQGGQSGFGGQDGGPYERIDVLDSNGRVVIRRYRI